MGERTPLLTFKGVRAYALLEITAGCTATRGTAFETREAAWHAELAEEYSWYHAGRSDRWTVEPKCIAGPARALRLHRRNGIAFSTISLARRELDIWE